MIDGNLLSSFSIMPSYAEAVVPILQPPSEVAPTNACARGDPGRGTRASRRTVVAQILTLCGRPFRSGPQSVRAGHPLCGLLAAAGLWAFTCRRRAPPEDGLPLGQDGGGALGLAAPLRTALGSRQALEAHPASELGGKLAAMGQMTPSAWTSCTAVRW